MVPKDAAGGRIRPFRGARNRPESNGSRTLLPTSGATPVSQPSCQSYARQFGLAPRTPAQQLEFLRGHDHHQFFQQLRGAVLVAVFSNPSWGGNRDKAGWRILGFEDRFSWQPPFGWYDAKANGGPN